jgi:synaptotagmin-1
MKQTSQTDPTYGFGKITFTLFYNQQISSLIVTILSIDNLPYRDINSKILPDPFIKIILLPDRRRKFQTKVSKRTQSPQFNETFQFQINYEELRRRLLLLSVYDFGRSTKRSLIGTVKVDDVSSMPDITTKDVTCTRSIVPGTEVSSVLNETFF